MEFTSPCYTHVFTCVDPLLFILCIQACSTRDTEAMCSESKKYILWFQIEDNSDLPSGLKSCLYIHVKCTHTKTSRGRYVLYQSCQMYLSVSTQWLSEPQLSRQNSSCQIEAVESLIFLLWQCELITSEPHRSQQEVCASSSTTVQKYFQCKTHMVSLLVLHKIYQTSQRRCVRTAAMQYENHFCLLKNYLFCVMNILGYIHNCSLEKKAHWFAWHSCWPQKKLTKIIVWCIF